MPNYKLGVTIKGEGRTIDLDIVPNSTKLENLDKFTTGFENEIELKSYLIKKEIIGLSEGSRKIYVYYKNDYKLKHIPVFYKNMGKYLDIFYLRSKIMSFINDLNFLEELANHYSNGKTTFNKQLTNVNYVRSYLNNSKNGKNDSYELNYLIKTIDDIIEKATYTIDKDNNVKENYRGIRDLACFIFDYTNKLETKKENSKTDLFEQIRFEDVKMKDDPFEYKYDYETREPYFPPNSEEERLYQKYLEKLSDISDEKYRQEALEDSKKIK